MKILESAFDYDIALIQKGQTVGNRPGAVQVVSHNDGSHLMLALQLENQIVDLSGTDGIKSGSRLVEKQNLRLQRQRACQPNAFLHPA